MSFTACWHVCAAHTAWWGSSPRRSGLADGYLVERVGRCWLERRGTNTLRQERDDFVDGSFGQTDCHSQEVRGHRAEDRQSVFRLIDSDRTKEREGALARHRAVL